MINFNKARIKLSALDERGNPVEIDIGGFISSYFISSIQDVQKNLMGQMNIIYLEDNDMRLISL